MTVAELITILEGRPPQANVYYRRDGEYYSVDEWENDEEHDVVLEGEWV